MEASSGVCHALSTARKLAGNVIVRVQVLCISTCRSAQLDVFMMYYIDSTFSFVTVMCVCCLLSGQLSKYDKVQASVRKPSLGIAVNRCCTVAVFCFFKLFLIKTIIDLFKV